MASAAISLALILVALVALPLRLWASRIAGGRSKPPSRIRRQPAPAHLRPALRRLVRCGRELVAAVEQLGPITAEYRRTLPYSSLFFAERNPHVRRDRWVVQTREDFETAVCRVARSLQRWQLAYECLDGVSDEALVRAGGVPVRAVTLLREGSRLPRDERDARRFRFCEDWEVDRLLDDLDAIADELRAVDVALSAPHGGPYRSAG